MTTDTGTVIERDLTVPQVARLLGIHKERARALLLSGEVRSVYRVGKQLRVAPSCLRDWQLNRRLA